MLTLYIGNKNYSSWSMRPWVLMTQAGIDFKEVMVRFDGFDPDSTFKQKISALNPFGRVPVLVDETGFAVTDSLAIVETLAERFPGLHLWPQEVHARARARSVCAEMHSGFAALRNACPMNIEASLPDIGRIIWREQPAVHADAERICSIWEEALHIHGGPFLFGSFSIADAFFAPVCMRFTTYALPVPERVTAYIQAVQALPSVQLWRQQALAEKDFRAFEEPYRKAPDWAAGS